MPHLIALPFWPRSLPRPNFVAGYTSTHRMHTCVVRSAQATMLAAAERRFAKEVAELRGAVKESLEEVAAMESPIQESGCLSRSR